MLSKEVLSKIINAMIEKEENIGENSSTSGHLGYVQYHLDSIDKCGEIIDKSTKCYEITYTYSLQVETEFTYYPDNSPRVYIYQKTIIVDLQGNVVHDTPKKTLKHSR